MAYKIYTTDALRLISENTAKFGGGGYITKRWIDVMQPKQQDARTGEEIVADVIKKAGLEVKRNGTI